MGMFSFTSKWFGLNGVKGFFKSISQAVDGSVGKRQIETLLLKETKDRFEPRGSNAVAQTAPDGTPWKLVTKETIRRRKSNRNASQALSDTKTLQSSIVILRSNTESASARSHGATAQIGVNPSSPAYKYFKLHQEGGLNAQGKYIDARPFLGVAKATEAKVEKSISGTMRSFLGRFF